MHESAHAWALGLTIAVGCIGVDVAYLLAWATPVWLVVGFWLWCALVNLQVTVFFSGLAPHWFLYFPFWVVAGTGISIASKTLPPAYAAIISVP